MNTSNASGLIDRLQIQVVQASADKSIVVMPVIGNTQPAGFLHGGASAALAETAASIAALHHGESMGSGYGAVGTELSISHLRPAKSGVVTATATALHLGRTSTIHDVQIRDDSGELISAARVTNRIVSR